MCNGLGNRRQARLMSHPHSERPDTTADRSELDGTEQSGLLAHETPGAGWPSATEPYENNYRRGRCVRVMLATYPVWPTTGALGS
jgi:hypothetical protein